MANDLSKFRPGKDLTAAARRLKQPARDEAPTVSRDEPPAEIMAEEMPEPVGRRDYRGPGDADLYMGPRRRRSWNLPWDAATPY